MRKLFAAVFMLFFIVCAGSAGWGRTISIGEAIDTIYTIPLTYHSVRMMREENVLRVFAITPQTEPGLSLLMANVGVDRGATYFDTQVSPMFFVMRGQNDFVIVKLTPYGFYNASSYVYGFWLYPGLDRVMSLDGRVYQREPGEDLVSFLERVRPLGRITLTRELLGNPLRFWLPVPQGPDGTYYLFIGASANDHFTLDGWYDFYLQTTFVHTLNYNCEKYYEYLEQLKEPQDIPELITRLAEETRDLHPDLPNDVSGQIEWQLTHVYYPRAVCDPEWEFYAPLNCAVSANFIVQVMEDKREKWHVKRAWEVAINGRFEDGSDANLGHGFVVAELTDGTYLACDKQGCDYRGNTFIEAARKLIDEREGEDPTARYQECLEKGCVFLTVYDTWKKTAHCCYILFPFEEDIRFILQNQDTYLSTATSYGIRAFAVFSLNWAENHLFTGDDVERVLAGSY